MTAAGELPEATWGHWGGFIHGCRSCRDPPARRAAAELHPHPADPLTHLTVRLQRGSELRPRSGSGRLQSLRGGWRAQMTPAVVATQDLPRKRRRRRRISLMTARWRSCFSSKSLQASERVSTGCSSSTPMWSGEAGSSTWPPVTGQIHECVEGVFRSFTEVKVPVQLKVKVLHFKSYLSKNTKVSSAKCS